MRASTAKALAALALTGVGSALVIGFRTTDVAVGGTPVGAASASSSENVAVIGGSSGTASPPSATASPDPSSTDTTPTTPTTTDPAGGSQYADGTYAGTAISEPWGTFQVQAVFSGGQLSDVVLVSSPQDRHSMRINSQAVPILTESAIAAQSANVDMVSGATWTSQSYVTSLQSALDQAKAAAAPAG